MGNEIRYIDLYDNNFEEKFQAITGIKPGDTIEIKSSPIERDKKISISIPKNLEEWNNLKNMTISDLCDLGLFLWNITPDENFIMLFPYEWYNFIPDGYEIVDLSGEEKKFYKSKFSSDKRFGCLAYGILIDKKTTK